MRKLLVTDSSNIVSVGYDPFCEILQLEFNGGQIYQYSHVTAQDFAHLVSAKSVGEWFAKHIKPYPQLYVYRKVEPET